MQLMRILAMNLTNDYYKKMQKYLHIKKNRTIFAVRFFNGALAHLVERNTGSVEVSGSSPLCSTVADSQVVRRKIVRNV